MPVINRIVEFSEDVTVWLRDLHAYPETPSEEKRTSNIVATELEEFGIEVHRGLSRSGVVSTLMQAVLICNSEWARPQANKRE